MGRQRRLADIVFHLLVADPRGQLRPLYLLCIFARIHRDDGDGICVIGCRADAFGGQMGRVHICGRYLRPVAIPYFSPQLEGDRRAQIVSVVVVVPLLGGGDFGLLVFVGDGNGGVARGIIHDTVGLHQVVAVGNSNVVTVVAGDLLHIVGQPHAFHARGILRHAVPGGRFPIIRQFLVRRGFRVGRPGQIDDRARISLPFRYPGHQTQRHAVIRGGFAVRLPVLGRLNIDGIGRALVANGQRAFGQGHLYVIAHVRIRLQCVIPDLLLTEGVDDGGAIGSLFVYGKVGKGHLVIGILLPRSREGHILGSRPAVNDIDYVIRSVFHRRDPRAIREHGLAVGVKSDVFEIAVLAVRRVSAGADAVLVVRVGPFLGQLDFHGSLDLVLVGQGADNRLIGIRAARGTSQGHVLVRSFPCRSQIRGLHGDGTAVTGCRIMLDGRFDDSVDDLRALIVILRQLDSSIIPVCLISAIFFVIDIHNQALMLEFALGDGDGVGIIIVVRHDQITGIHLDDAQPVRVQVYLALVSVSGRAMIVAVGVVVPGLGQGDGLVQIGDNMLVLSGELDGDGLPTRIDVVLSINHPRRIGM